MGKVALLILGLALFTSGAQAQTADRAAPPLVGTAGAVSTQKYTPLTGKDRLRLYLKSTFGPKAIFTAGFTGALSQGTGNPKEWGKGAAGYGDRVGNSFAKHVIQESLEHPAAALLHEDDRYFRSNDTGVWKRSRHAVVSIFLAHNDAGQARFAYSRVGGVMGSAFISRIWQPPSTSGAQDAFVSFAFTMASDVGWNMFHEFWPDIRNHFKKH